MAKSSSHKSIIAQRYAKSLFELAQASDSMEAVQEELCSFKALLATSQDLQKLLLSPVIANKDQLAAIHAIAKAAQLEGDGAPGLVGDFLKLVAENGRLILLPDIISCYHNFVLDARGECCAELVSARALTPAQEKEITQLLKDTSGKTVRLEMKIDPSLLGGVVLRMGSQQIDASLLNKLSSLKLALKEVG